MKPTALPVHLDGIPNELKTIDRWVMWQLVQRKGRWTKMPLTVDGRAASSTDPNTWTTYDEV
jgi:primase-polymerase (primpol)-like protein